jgi:SAM-dependent methyltransferase
MKTTLNEKYWRSRYQQNDMPWDIGSISTPLKDYIDQLENKHQRILIPGCGFGHEARYLATKGFTQITCVDFAAEVFEKHPLEKLGIQCVVSDFFQFEGEFDLVLEQTFFCALDPVLRKNYVRHVQQLLTQKGKLVGVLFNMVKNDKPPFGGLQNEYETLFSPYFEFKTLAPCYNSVSTRNELFINFIKR